MRIKDLLKSCRNLTNDSRIEINTLEDKCLFSGKVSDILEKELSEKYFRTWKFRSLIVPVNDQDFYIEICV